MVRFKTIGRMTQIKVLLIQLPAKDHEALFDTFRD